MNELIAMIARALVDRPADVHVSEFDEEGDTVLELEVAPEDIGKIIGRQGRTVRALRSLLGAAGMKQRRRYVLEVLEREDR
jgi:predicted RNA-binding protein YlqC (UPF0109 family)